MERICFHKLCQLSMVLASVDTFSLSASACDSTAAYVKVHHSLYQRDVSKAALLLGKLSTFERDCKEMKAKIASTSASLANGRSCEAHREADRLYHQINEASEKCQTSATALHLEINLFSSNTMTPDAMMDRGLYEAISGDPYLRSRCGAEMKAAKDLSIKANEDRLRVEHAVARAADDIKKFKRLADTTKNLRNLSRSTAENCVGENSIVSSDKTPANGTPVVMVPVKKGSHRNPASSITGVKEDAEKRAKQP